MRQGEAEVLCSLGRIENLLGEMLEMMKRPGEEPTPEELERLYAPLMGLASRTAAEKYREQEELHILKYHAKPGGVN